MTIRISEPVAGDLSNDQLAARIKDAASALAARGEAGRVLAFQTCFGEAEDVALAFQHQRQLSVEFAHRVADLAHSAKGTQLADAIG